MKNKITVLVTAVTAAFVLSFARVPMDKVSAETEYVTIEDEEVPLGDAVEEGNGNIALILAGVSCVMTIGAAFIWLRSEKKRVVDDEE